MTSVTPFIFLQDAAKRFSDARGFLDIFYEDGGVVLKRSFSRAGVFRGMHWQPPPYAQTKLIRVVTGRILDFVADPQIQNPELLYRELGPADGWICISAQWAHGFYASEDTEFEYLCHGAYNEGAESSFSIVEVLRSVFDITQPFLSEKDASAPALPVSGIRRCP